MKPVITLIPLILSLTAPVRAQPSPPVPTFISSAPAPLAIVAASTQEASASGQILGLDEELKEAEQDYESGLQDFKSSQPVQGRAQMSKAFDLVVPNIDDPALPDFLHSEFASMIYKIRNWDELRQAGDAAPDLDVSPEALALSSATAAVKMQPVPIDASNPIVQKFIQIYAQRRPGSVEEALSRSGLYRDMISDALRKKGLPPELFYLVMAESEFKGDAFSRSGAAGLWQFMPGTARKYGLKVSYWQDERYLPEKETAAAVNYLYDLYQWFGNWDLALAAYNRGEGGLGQEMQMSRSLNFDTLSSRDALPLQTHLYVPKFEACVLIGEHPEKYGLHPQYQALDPYDTVPMPHALDLSIAARCAGTTIDVIHKLNPELRAWCTPTDDPDFELRIPQGSKAAFFAALTQVTDWNPGPTMIRYRVRSGDFLGKIARLNHTTVEDILETNKIRNLRRIRPGTVLLIRPGIGRPTAGRHRRGRHRMRLKSPASKV